MRKGLKIVVIVWAVLATLLMGFFGYAAREFSMERDALEAKYEELKEHSEELEETRIEGLTYEAIVGILADGKDVSDAVDDLAEEHGLSAYEEVEILSRIEIWAKIHAAIAGSEG